MMVASKLYPKLHWEGIINFNTGNNDIKVINQIYQIQ